MSQIGELSSVPFELCSQVSPDSKMVLTLRHVNFILFYLMLFIVLSLSMHEFPLI